MKIKTQLFSLLIMACCFLVACNSKTPEAVKPIDMDSLRVEIQAMEDAYAAGEKEKDANKVAAYYSDDAVSYNRNMQPLSGKAAITERITTRLAADTSGITIVYKVVDLYAQGDMAVEIGSWKEVSPAGEEVNNGHYMSYFQKRDGKYVCVRDMNVTSMPDTVK